MIKTVATNEDIFLSVNHLSNIIIIYPDIVRWFLDGSGQEEKLGMIKLCFFNCNTGLTLRRLS